MVANSRDECGSEPFHYWSLPICNTFPAGFEGFCWKGLDFWTYTAEGGTARSPLNTYVHFGNMVGSTPRTLAMPGPAGAVATAQFECLREGTQDTEAMLFLRDAFADEATRKRLGDEWAARCQAAIDAMCGQMEVGLRIRPQGGSDVFRLSREIHALAGDVAEKVSP